MHNLTLSNLLTWRVRVFLYLSSLSTLLFTQNYCINVCPFINSLGSLEFTSNLFIIFLLHIAIREFLFFIFKKPFKNTSLQRHAYYLSIISWISAGVAAFFFHYFKYPGFPVSSHIKLLSSYWILGAGILAQIEYLLFEYEFKNIAPNAKFYIFNERISRRIVESFLVLSIAPVATLLLILARYKYEGLISSHVIYEMTYVASLFVAFALLSAVTFGKMLKDDTKKILQNIDYVKNGQYDINIDVNRADELGEISSAIENMSSSIQDGINEIEKLNDEIINTQREVVFTMGEIAESRSKETGNHVKRVAEYSEVLALKYGLSQEESKLLRLASPMHDIGKVAIPDNILNKPGKHTPEEFEIMKTHALLGYGMLKHSNREILKAASIVAYEHHEKWDGSGYPRSINGENIHIYGRITAVADVFDALGSDRCYKKAWEDEKIFELLETQKGKHFDPYLVELFFDNIDLFLEIRDRYRD